MPNMMPINRNKRISPLLNTNIEDKIIHPVKIQNNMSSIYVIKSFVLNVFLNILKKSNNSPIKKPFTINIRNRFVWVVIIKSFALLHIFYLKILLIILPVVFSAVLSL